MRVDLTPDAESWVEAEIASGRSATPAEAVQKAVKAAKLTRLRADIGEAEAEGGAHTSEDVRVFVGTSLDEWGGSTPDRA